MWMLLPPAEELPRKFFAITHWLVTPPLVSMNHFLFLNRCCDFSDCLLQVCEEAGGEHCPLKWDVLC